MSGAFPQALIGEVGEAFGPLVRAADSPDDVFEMLRAYGWDLRAALGTDPSGFMAAVRAVAEAAGVIEQWAADPPGDLAGVRRGLEAVGRSAAAVRTLRDRVAAADPRLLAPLPGDVVERLLAAHLLRRRPVTFYALALLGLVDADPGAPVADGDHLVRVPTDVPGLRLERLGRLLADPAAFLSAEYAPGGVHSQADASGVAARLFPRIAALAAAAGAEPLLGSGLSPRTLDAAGELLLDAMLTIAARVPNGDGVRGETGATLHVVGPDDAGGAGLFVAPFGEGEARGDVAGWTVRWLAASAGGAVLVRTGRADEGRFELLDPTSGSARLELSASAPAPGAAGAAAPAPAVVIGAPAGTRLECARVGASVRLAVDARVVDYGLQLDASGATLVLTAGEGDGFLRKVLPAETRLAFDAQLGWSRRRGLFLGGGAGALEATLPARARVGDAAAVDAVHLAIRSDGDAVRLVAATTATVRLGPVTVVAERFGLEAVVTFPADGGNLGPAHLELGFKAPSGAALSVSAPGLTGAGYLFVDPGRRQYAGALQLAFAERFTLNAIGILTTRLPDGAPGYALLVLITAEDFAPVQLGLGFTLTGVGGLLALNRTVAVDVLRAGLKADVLDAVLFPRDPAGNAPAIIGSLNAVFPPAPDRFLVGPMAIIGWGTPTVITLKLALLLELPAPVRLVVLGRLEAQLPDAKRALVRIRLDAIGVIDFTRGELSLDATLYDSRLLTYALTGDMALRASWGDRPSLVLAVGGLNPRFPVPAGFPRLDRVAVSVVNRKNLRLRMEAYVALTSNTIQFGARAELYAAAGPFSVDAHVGFDALFQFSPFRFVADVSAHVALRAFGRTIAGVWLEAELAGPKPWHVRGRATISTFLGSKTFHVDETVGEPSPPVLPERTDVGALLLEALRDPRNWAGELPRDARPLVALREPAGAGAVVHPLAVLTVRQRVVPLERRIETFGNTLPTGDREFRLTASSPGPPGGPPAVPPAVAPRPVTDLFAPGQFAKLTDDQKLAAPAFEAMRSGLEFGSSAVAYDAGQVLETGVEYETRYVDPVAGAPGGTAQGRYAPSAEAFAAMARLGAAGRADVRAGGNRYREDPARETAHA